MITDYDRWRDDRDADLAEVHQIATLREALDEMAKVQDGEPANAGKLRCMYFVMGAERLNAMEPHVTSAWEVFRHEAEKRELL